MPRRAPALIGLTLATLLAGCDGTTTHPGAAARGEAEALPAPSYALGEVCREDFNVGSEVLPFELPSVEGDKLISPAGYRGRVMVLNFWGTWCKPCLEELPQFDQLYRKYRAHGMTLVAVATDEEPELVEDFMAKHKLKAKIALSGEDAAGAYGRPNFPFTFVVDGQGQIVAAYQFIEDACMGDLEQVIRDELAKLPQAE